jgi:hypothetical protein
MGRLIEPVSNGRARLMIEVPLAGVQNPAYRFAAVQYTPLGAFVYSNGVILFLIISQISV